MKKINLNYLDFGYEITGKSGKKYLFNQKDIKFYHPNTHFPFTGNSIYIFVKDPDSQNPVLIDIDFRNDWKIQYKEIDKFESISKHNPTHLLYYRKFDPGEEHQIITDILNGSDILLSNTIDINTCY